ncbi:hypothetical protein DFH27DRAFT_524046 [Peziza echinospora]|nr:hypothetical protein DFH27DRAFT_524046 [Peziza echinospora]
MNYTSCRAGLRSLQRPLKHTARSVTDHAIMRGLRASPAQVRREDDDYDSAPRRPKIDQFPDYFVSSASAYTPPRAEDRRARRTEDFRPRESAPPLVGARGGIVSSPRRDAFRNRYEDSDSLSNASRMNIRRHIPKLVADSEYIYGTSVVESALRSERRELYRFYLYAGERRTPENRARDLKLKTLARKLHPKMEIIDEYDLGNLDSMTDSRTHNGYVIECSPLKKIPIQGLGAVAPDLSHFGVQLAQHSDNPRMILREQATILKNRDPSRNPFVVMLDEILDPGNLGAIIRSAYYLGAEALVVSSIKSAPLSAVCQKASAGATEWLPIYEYANAAKFIALSKANGWQFYAAVPPVAEGATPSKNYIDEAQIGNPLQKRPCCIIFGSEGDGLRRFLATQAHYQVTIKKGLLTDGMIDSLNVSVATAILCDRFVNPPVVPHFVMRKGKVKKVIIPPAELEVHTPQVIRPPREVNFLTPKPVVVKKPELEEPAQPRVAIEHDTTFTLEEASQESDLPIDQTLSVEETLEQDIAPSHAEEALVIDTTVQEEQTIVDSAPVEVLATTETSPEEALVIGTTVQEEQIIVDGAPMEVLATTETSPLLELEKETEGTSATGPIDSEVPQTEATQPLATPQ